jgi:hypothetical protein
MAILEVKRYQVTCDRCGCYLMDPLTHGRAEYHTHDVALRDLHENGWELNGNLMFCEDCAEENERCK